MRKAKTDITSTTEKKPKIPKKSKIVTWVPKDEDMIARYDGSVFIMRFDKLFIDEEAANYMKFIIKKGSYEKQLDVITKYINFFIKFYDQEHELPTAYLKIKFDMDKYNRFNENNYGQLIDLIYEVMFTDTIIKKVNQLVEDNYLDDIESSEDTKKYINKEKKHLESLEFTNQHIKILLRISFGMKMIAPILFHYVFINHIKLDKDSDLIYQFYRRLFDIFGDGVSLYNKLFVYIKAKVLESKSHNSPIFEQRDIMGSDEYLVISQFLRKVLISENIVKYKFNENYDIRTHKYKENIVGFLLRSSQISLIAGKSYMDNQQPEMVHRLSKSRNT